MGLYTGSQEDFYRKNGYVKVGNRWVYQGKKSTKDSSSASGGGGTPSGGTQGGAFGSPEYGNLLSQLSSNEALLAQYQSGQQAQSFAAEQARAAAAAQQQEQLRAQAEADRRRGAYQSFVGGLGLSNVDQDSYAGESSQAASYRQFLESQLGTAGFNAGSLLSGYDPTAAINAARMTNEGFQNYKNSLFGYGGTDYAAVQGQALGAQSQNQQALMGYDQQVRDQLSQLGQAYTAYAQLGDINQFQGTGQERVSQLFGINRPDIESINQSFTGMGNEYSRLARETQMLYGGDVTPTASTQYNQQMQAWSDIASRYNPAAQGLLSTYGSAANTLYGMYGNLQDVMSGRIRSEAERQRGLVSSSLNTVSGVLGEAGQAGTRLQDLYNQTASTLRTQRIAEGQQIREQQAQFDFAEKQNRMLGVAATTLQKPAERTQLATRLRRPDENTYQSDPLGLTRGYSSLLGG